MPARDDALPLYVKEQGAMLGKTGDELTVKKSGHVLHAVGFDPMLGFYHRLRYGRPSLALDLAESFRPLVADSTVLTLVNNSEVTASSFIRRAGAVALTGSSVSRCRLPENFEPALIVGDHARRLQRG